jgi:hypothetical protein
VAVLAAGEERVAAWVRDCLLPDVRLVPGTRRLGGAVATWAVRDALGCYWRARLDPDGFAPPWDAAPAGTPPRPPGRSPAPGPAAPSRP